MGHSAERRPREPRVCLIRPTMVSSKGTWSNPVTPPLGMAYLAAMLRENGTPFQVIDGIAEAIDQYIEEGEYLYQGLTIPQTVDRIDPASNLIGVSCMFTQDWPWMSALIQAIRVRFPEALIIAGGEHITALPEFNLRACPALDVCVLGEGEETLVDIVDHLREDKDISDVRGIAYLHEGIYMQTMPRERIRNVDEMPRPAWDLFPMEVYLESKNAHGVYRGRSMGILATRGCPYKCTFCSNPVMYGKAWYAREPSDVLDEIQYDIETYGAQNIDFYDLTMILKKSWILEFCKLIEERGLTFTWQLPTGTRSEVITPEVSPWLFRTGCRNITFSPESGSADTLKKIKKQVKKERLTSAIRAALRAGINVKCNIVIGFPHETRRHVWETMKYCWKLAAVGVHDVGVFLYSPYPGSELFTELRAEGRIQDLDDEYFESLVALMDPWDSSAYCRHLSGRELVVWRWLTMGTFFALQFLLRPKRLVQLVRNVIRNDSDTVLAQRLGAKVHRPREMRKAAPGHP